MKYCKILWNIINVSDNIKDIKQKKRYWYHNLTISFPSTSHIHSHYLKFLLLHQYPYFNLDIASKTVYPTASLYHETIDVPLEILYSRSLLNKLRVGTYLVMDHWDTFLVNSLELWLMHVWDDVQAPKYFGYYHISFVS